MFRTMLLSKYFKKLSSRGFASVKAGGGSSVPAPDYQPWSDGVPDSPLLTVDYPYQSVVDYGGIPYVYMSVLPQYINATSYTQTNGLSKVYQKSGTSWSFSGEAYAGSGMAPIDALRQANNNIFTDNTLTAVYFPKTTA